MRGSSTISISGWVDDLTRALEPGLAAAGLLCPGRADRRRPRPGCPHAATVGQGSGVVEEPRAESPWPPPRRESDSGPGPSRTPTRRRPGPSVIRHIEQSSGHRHLRGRLARQQGLAAWPSRPSSTRPCGPCGPASTWSSSTCSRPGRAIPRASIRPSGMSSIDNDFTLPPRQAPHAGLLHRRPGPGGVHRTDVGRRGSSRDALVLDAGDLRPAPLEATYRSAWEAVPSYWRDVLSAPAAAGDQPDTLGAAPIDEDHPHPRLPRRAAAARGQLQVVRRQVGRRSSTARRRGRDRRRAHRLRRGLPARARSTCRPTPTASGPASPSWGRTCSARTRCSSASSTAAWTPPSRAIPTSSRRSTWPAGTSSARRTGQPVCVLLGGRYGEDFVLYRAISQESPEAMAGARRRLSRRGLSPLPAQGRRRPDDRHRAHPRRRGRAPARRPPGRRRQHRLADARRPARRPGRPRRRRLHRAALPELRGVPDGPPAQRSPVRAGRGRSTRSTSLLRGHADRAMDVVNIKISKFGGLTKARQARDLCVSLGIAMTLEDSWGGDIVDRRDRPPGPQHAAGVPVHRRPTSTATSPSAPPKGAPQRQGGRMAASTAPGLGVTPRMDVLGEPVVVVEVNRRDSSEEHPPMNGRIAMVALCPRRSLDLARLSRRRSREGAFPTDGRADLPGARLRGRRCLGAMAARRRRLHDVGRLEGDIRRAGPRPARPGDAARARSSCPAAHLIPPGEVAPLHVDDYALSKDRARLLIFTNSRRVWRQNTRGDYWVLDRATRELRKLGGDAPRLVADARQARAGRPAGRLRARQQHLRGRPPRRPDHAADALADRPTRSTARSTGSTRRNSASATDSAGAPTARSIAYWQLNTAGMREYPLVNTTDSLYPGITPVKYPKVGERNAACRIGVVSAVGGRHVLAAVPATRGENYIAYLEWADANRAGPSAIQPAPGHRPCARCRARTSRRGHGHDARSSSSTTTPGSTSRMSSAGSTRAARSTGSSGSASATAGGTSTRSASPAARPTLDHLRAIST